MHAPYAINTPRLILKCITPEWIHRLFTTQTKEEIIAYFGLDEAGYEQYKVMHEKGMETHRYSMLYFLLMDRERNIPIGDCGFHTWNKTHRRAELFYVMRREEEKRKGLMTEALQYVLDYGFTELDLHRIEALVADWNIASVKLLQRYGFTLEGTMREDYCVKGINENSHCYSLLKWEWHSATDK